jgi:hypothetical protein
MARTRLADIPLVQRIKQASMSQAQPIIVKNSQGTTTTIYAAITGTGTLTNSFSLASEPWIFTSGLPGFLEPGTYQITCGGAVAQVFDTTATDGTLTATIAGDDLTSVYNAPVMEGIYGVGATLVSQTIKFVRIVPDKQITAATVILVSGTAAA